jgi:hypothetical protein
MGGPVNVQPGDLAMIVRNTTGDGCVDNLIGTPLQVVRAYECEDGIAWAFQGPMLVCPACKAIEFFGFLDADLQRLRGPELKAKSHDALLDRVLHGEPA